MAEDSLLSHFDGKNILLVGFDCFVGKVVLVKLLTAVNPEKIFLIASKRNSEKALHELLNSEICDPIRMDMGPDFSEMVSERLCEIPANLQKDGLGLSTDDAATLREKLDVVIECSSADMDILPLKDAVRKNVDDPLRLLTFTKECTKTPPFVHVSTAFANANHQGMVTVTETLHELPFDFHDVLQEIREASDSDIKSVQNRLMRGWPNAFTFTKALGEHALAVNRDSTDLFILRPSFVSPALSGPVAGYTETASIPAAFVFAGAAGVARSFYAEPSYKVDLIPVDFCADAVIACGGEALAEPEPSSSSSSSAPASAPVSPGREREERRNTRGRRREGDLGRLEVVAVSTSALNPARWEMLARTVNLYFHENPVPEDQLMGPRAASNGLTVELRTSIHKHRLAVAREKQQRLFSASNSSHARAAKKVLEQQLEPFMNSEWVFQGEKLALLAERLSDEDRQHLKLDVRSIVWDGYLKILCYGVERFLLHNLKAQPPAVTMTSEPMPCGVSRVSWDIDHFSVPKKGGSLKLLQGVKGSLEPGQVTAVMGPSGAGKSTFLMLLAGRGQTGELQGEIAVNGRSAAPEQLKSSCAFVEQEDSLLGYLTVDEELGFAARLRQESSDRAGKIGALRRSHAIDRVKRELGLEDIGDRPIGDYFRKGISGGQKRRVSIGKELVASRSILFLDEPTSGLDSFSCLQVIRAISELAKRRMLTVFVTIHQPSQEVLQVFDRIIFLTRGKLAYDGPVNYVLPFFDQLGYPAPPNTNAADHVIQVINTDFHEAKEEIDELVRKSAELSEKARTEGWANVFGSTAPAVKSLEETDVETPSPPPPPRPMGTSSLSGISKPTNGWGNLHSSMATAATAAGGALERSETCPPINPSAPTLPIQKSTSMSGGFHRRTYSSLRDEKQLQQLDISQVTGAARNAPWNSQVMIQMARMGKGIVRDPMGFAMRFALEFSIKVVMVGQWYRLNEDFRGAVTIVGGGLENVIGVLVFSLVATSFCALQGMPGMASERKIFVAEQRGNLYAPSSYLVATLLMRLPILMLLQIPNCLLIYYGLGLGDFAQNQLLNFWYYVIIQWTIIWVAEFGSLCVTFFTTNETLAWAMSVYAQAIMLMWSGGIQRVSTMYLVFRYLSTVSFIRWGMDALLWNFIPGRCYEYPGCEGACGFKNPQTGQPNFVDNCAVDGKMLLRSLFNEGTMPDFSPGRLLPPLMNLVIAFILLVTLYFLIMNSIEKSKPAKKAQQKGASASSSEDPDNNRHDEIGRIVGLPSFAPQATMGSQGSDGRPARVASWTAATFSRNMTMQADVPLNRQGSAGGSGGGSSGGARRRKASNIGGTVPSNLRLDRKMSKESEDAQTPSPGIHDWNQVVRSPGLRVEPQGPTGDQRV